MAAGGSRCRRRRRSRRSTSIPTSCRRFATACGWSSTRAAPAAGRGIAGYDVSGKTGTAQVISNTGPASPPARTDKDLRDNGWFVFFAPRDNPKIAGVVFLEHGIHGGNAAAVAHHILETFFAKKEGRPLPPAPADFHLNYIDPYAHLDRGPVRGRQDEN